MNSLTPKIIIATSSDDDLLKLLGAELGRRLPNGKRANDDFVAEIRKLPIGLRAMAATFELDVSLTLDDIGWHFGNWRHVGLAKETTAGLRELGATELADIFQNALVIAQDFWAELGTEAWHQWYPGSAFEKAVNPLDAAARAILDATPRHIFGYWLKYARQFPERLQDDLHP